MNVIGDGTMASEAENLMRRKECFQISCHRIQPKGYAKLIVNEKMVLGVKEKRTYKERKG